MSFTSTHTVVSPKRSTTVQDVQIQPTMQEIWKWTLTNEAIAPCFVRDVYAMRDSVIKDADFFWLGRVPCRSARIVGIVVGVQVYDKRILYSVDDGTSVIDCVHRQPQSLTSLASRGGLKPSTHDPPAPPTPVVDVGSPVSVVGRVTRWHGSRQINVANIERCASYNDELAHWRTVLALHKSSYDLLEPFVIPHVTSTWQGVGTSILGESQLDPVPEPRTPSSSARIFSPISSVVSSSAKSTTMQSPPRLRHPSRLHSRDLTANTFRIYLKHYMDNAPALVLGQRGDKSRQGKGKETALTQEDDLTSTTRGFTSSYLRRVPELADMAKRVVKAEAKRRAREDRNRTKGRDQQMGLSMKEDPHSRGASRKEDLRGNLGSKQQGLDPGPKMKRLFGWAIVKLYEEGSIVIWDGPVRHCGEAGCNSASVIWRVNSNTDTSYPDSTVFSSITEPSRLENDSDPGELSDPQSDEEAYIPLSPAYLASHVEKVIGTLMASHSTISGDVLASGRTVSNRAPQPGPTKEQITSCLRRDGRWARVGEWAVDDALEVLQAEGKVWGIGGGRWELCR